MRFCILCVVALLIFSGATASAAAPRLCGGSPLAFADNVGETILHGVRSIRSVIGIAKVNKKDSGQFAGWLYLDDAGIVSVVVRKAKDAAAFGGKLGTGPFPVLRGLPLGFVAAPCN